MISDCYVRLGLLHPRIEFDEAHSDPLYRSRDPLYRSRNLTLALTLITFS